MKNLIISIFCLFTTNLFAETQHAQAVNFSAVGTVVLSPTGHAAGGGPHTVYMLSLKETNLTGIRKITIPLVHTMDSKSVKFKKQTFTRGDRVQLEAKGIFDGNSVQVTEIHSLKTL